MKKIWQNIADYIRETDKLLLLLCIIASLYGAMLIYSPTGFKTVGVQLISLLIGVSVAIIISLFDYSKLTKFYPVYIVATLALLVITYEIGYAPEGSDNRAWIRLPLDMSLQVSELIKIFMILTFAKHVSSIKPENINRFHNVVLLVLHGMAAPALVMVFQRDLGTVSVMIVIFLAMLYMSGVKLRYFIIGFLGLVAVSPLVWFYGLSDFQRKRFAIIFDLESDPLDLGYQQLQSIKAIGSGGVFGQGYLNGAKTQANAVPKAHNDFILTVAGEELGLIGCLLVFAILITIIVRILYVSTVSKDITGKIICAGAFGMLSAQLLINTGMVLSVLPVIGVTLPFFSAGGSSLMCLYISIGLVVSVYKNRHMRTMYLRDNI
ncbi:MAG: rod shape-determining protein RodA [Clostridia bacterium]|nr:rod shape-determining protein RodA [Clostridia bacterium]